MSYPNFATGAAWLITKGGQPCIFAADGKTEIGKVLKITTERTPDNFDRAEITILVNVGSEEEMNKFIEDQTPEAKKRVIDKILNYGK